jgi:hypothetical protein
MTNEDLVCGDCDETICVAIASKEHRGSAYFVETDYRQWDLFVRGTAARSIVEAHILLNYTKRNRFPKRMCCGCGNVVACVFNDDDNGLRIIFDHAATYVRLFGKPCQPWSAVHATCIFIPSIPSPWTFEPVEPEPTDNWGDNPCHCGCRETKTFHWTQGPVTRSQSHRRYTWDHPCRCGCRDIWFRRDAHVLRQHQLRF